MVYRKLNRSKVLLKLINKNIKYTWINNNIMLKWGFYKVFVITKLLEIREQYTSTIVNNNV